MAYRDYIHCDICDCKFIYDGEDRIRDNMADSYGDKTPIIICPDCADKVKVVKKKGNGSSKRILFITEVAKEAIARGQSHAYKPSWE